VSVGHREDGGPALLVAGAPELVGAERELLARRRVVRREGRARDARGAIESGVAEARVVGRQRETGGVASQLGPARDVEGARLRAAGELGHAGLAPRLQGGGDDVAASLRIAVLGGVEQATGVAEERVVADRLQRIAQHRVPGGPLDDTGVDRRESVQLGLEIARRRRRIDARLELPGVDPERPGKARHGRRVGRSRRGRVVIAGPECQKKEQCRGLHTGTIHPLAI
jgi:hypothetical protein